MKQKFTIVLERDGEQYIGHCPEVPGANGLGKTPEECVESVREAIILILQDRRDDAM